MIKKKVLVASLFCCLSGMSFGMEKAAIGGSPFSLDNMQIEQSQTQPVARRPFNLRDALLRISNTGGRPFTIQEDEAILYSFSKPSDVIEFFHWIRREKEEAWVLADLYPTRTDEEVLERISEFENNPFLRLVAREKIVNQLCEAFIFRSIPRPVSPDVW